MTFRLVGRAWDTEFIDALRRDLGALRMICPFIKARALARALAARLDALEVITRFNLADFAGSVGDIDALQLQLDASGAICDLKNLYAKLYVICRGRAMITSANLTGSGLSANHEFRGITEDGAAIERCPAYCDTHWQDAGNDLLRSQLDHWAHRLSKLLASGSPSSESGDLEAFGAGAGQVHAARRGDRHPRQRGGQPTECRNSDLALRPS